MPEWLSFSTFDASSSIPTLVLRLLLAWLAGTIVSCLARVGQSTAEGNNLSLTLILMSVLIAMATQIIGDNVARAFSLVGALSIVRFRTAVPAPRDVAFVLAAVVAGMAVGAGQYWIVGLGLLTVGLATLVGPLDRATQATPAATEPQALCSWKLNIQLGLAAGKSVEEQVKQLTHGYQLQTIETTRRGSSYEVTYDIKLDHREDPWQFVTQLHGVPGVEAVSFRPV